METDEDTVKKPDVRKLTDFELFRCIGVRLWHAHDMGGITLRRHYVNAVFEAFHNLHESCDYYWNILFENDLMGEIERRHAHAGLRKRGAWKNTHIAQPEFRLGLSGLSLDDFSYVGLLEMRRWYSQSDEFPNLHRRYVHAMLKVFEYGNPARCKELKSMFKRSKSLGQRIVKEGSDRDYVRTRSELRIRDAERGIFSTILL